ncbi:MAG: hypothetical protein ABI430_03290 [Candidatus Taylorbacteria bacterium]
MKKLVQERSDAIRLRKLGHSYRDIQAKVPVGKSTLSLWLSGLHLTDMERALLKKRVIEQKGSGIVSASRANRMRKSVREKKVHEIARQEFKENIRDKFFFVGIALYWAEGGKRSGCFQFVNSDPDMALLMIKWVERYLRIPKNGLKYKLFIHKPYEHDKVDKLWSQIIQVPAHVFLKTIYGSGKKETRKNPIYNGSLMIKTGGVDVLRKLIAWQKLLIKYYSSY